MIYFISISLMALLTSVVIFLGMRCCRNKLNYLDSEQNKRNMLLTNYSRILFITLLATIFAYFTIGLYFLESNKTSNIFALIYFVTIIIFIIYMCFYIIWTVKLNKNHDIYKNSNYLGIEHAFGFIIGITYSIILSITINLAFVL